MLPRDLNAEDNYGREYIKALLSIVLYSGGYGTFIILAQPFLLVITYLAIVDCLSVDTFVRSLYSFISSSNGTRAIPFFNRLCTNLADAYCDSDISKALVETALITTLISLREILKRERRAAFNEDLPDLINSL
jgi:hypothetical protein